MATDISAGIAARLDRLVFSASLKKLVLLISLGGAFEFYDLFMTAYIAPGLTALAIGIGATRLQEGKSPAFRWDCTPTSQPLAT